MRVSSGAATDVVLHLPAARGGDPVASTYAVPDAPIDVELPAEARGPSHHLLRRDVARFVPLDDLGSYPRILSADGPARVTLVTCAPPFLPDEGWAVNVTRSQLDAKVVAQVDLDRRQERNPDAGVSLD